jgi:hypothetical protein
MAHVLHFMLGLHNFGKDEILHTEYAQGVGRAELQSYGHVHGVWLYAQFWISNQIYWIPWIQRMITFYSSLWHTNTLVSTLTSSLPLLGSGFQRRTFLFLCDPELSSCLTYQLTTTEPQQFSNYLTTPTNSTKLNRLSVTVQLIISSHEPHRKKTVLLLLCNCCRGYMQSRYLATAVL